MIDTEIVNFKFLNCMNQILYMIITISGQAGSGKSTVAAALAKKLGFRHYSIGDIRRKMAKERGITLAELNKLGEKEMFTDKDVDGYQKGLGEKEDNFVIDGRLSFHFIPHSVKVYLKADINARVKRVFQDERTEEHFHNTEDTKKALEEREKSDTKRYKKYYNLDCNDRKHYDLVIDSSEIPAENAVEKILKFVKEKKG